jgi:hypothetical protein
MSLHLKLVILISRMKICNDRPDDGGSTHLRNDGQFLWNCTAQYTRTQLSSCYPPWELEISLVHQLFLCIFYQPSTINHIISIAIWNTVAPVCSVHDSLTLLRLQSFVVNIELLWARKGTGDKSGRGRKNQIEKRLGSAEFGRDM